MSIYNFCTKKQCKTSFSLDRKKCPKCQTTVPRENKSFRIAVMVNGQYVKKVIHNTLTIVRQIEAQIKNELFTGVYFDRAKNNYTLKDVWNQYYNSRKATGLKSLEKLKIYYEILIAPAFGDQPIQNIKTAALERFKNEMLHKQSRNGRNYAPKTIKNVLDLINVLFNYARKILDYSGSNPCEKIDRLKINNTVINIVPLETFRDFLTFLETWPDKSIANLFKFSAFTGVRIGEALKLTWDDVNNDYGIIRLRDPKGGKDVSLPLNDSAKAVLNAHKTLVGNSPTIFGLTYKQAYNQFQRIKRGAELPDNFRIHDIRHQFATMLLNAGESITDVQHAMTHKDSKTTEKYAHYLRQTVKKTVNKIDDILKK